MAPQEHVEPMPNSAAQHSPQQQQKQPFRVRTVTVFLELPQEVTRWEREVAAAGTFLKLAQQHLERLGYEVQTIRIATQPFPEYLSGGSSSSSSGSGQSSEQQQQQQQHPAQHVYVRNVRSLEALAAKHGIHLVSIGSSSNSSNGSSGSEEELAVIPHIITNTTHVSCSYNMSAGTDYSQAQTVAAAIMQIAAATKGLGNFRFAAASNMKPSIPYFPVATAGAGMHRSFAIGTECDALLYEAFTAAASSSSSKVDILAAAEHHLAAILEQHLGKLEAAALDIEAAAAAAVVADQAPDHHHHQQQQQQQRFTYLGIDSSIAPGLDTPALTDSYELLGLGKFGGPGSLTVSSVITRVLRNLNIKLTGYCGLMLAVCEDQGLAAAAADGSVTISQLLQYSAVCGCGLDTVPVPGPTASSCCHSGSSTEPDHHHQQQHADGRDPAAAAAGAEDAPAFALGADGMTNLQQQPQHSEVVPLPAGAKPVAAAAAAAKTAAAAMDDAETTRLIAALLCDVNTLAHRLNKPLACRLLPLPGKKAGDLTDFNHPYMVNSRVMHLSR